jgi:hypothetical protein
LKRLDSRFHGNDRKVIFPLPWREGRKGRGTTNRLKYLYYSPSPQPSPVEGEGVFLTFYEIINLYRRRAKFPAEGNR